MKKILFALLLISNSGISQTAASNPHSMNIYAELGGPSVVGLNFDTRFTKKQTGIGGRIGFGGFSISDNSVGGTGTNRTSLLFIPIGVNYLLGKDKNLFEIGASVTPVVSSSTTSTTSSSRVSTTFGNLILGYRLQPQTSGFTFRAFVSPIIAKGVFWPIYGGLSFGYKF